MGPKIHAFPTRVRVADILRPHMPLKKHLKDLLQARVDAEWPFPRILVCHMEDGRYEVMDGVHRVSVALECSDEWIPAYSFSEHERNVVVKRFFRGEVPLDLGKLDKHIILPNGTPYQERKDYGD